MNLTGKRRIVSSPDFDDDYLRLEVEPYVEMTQRGSHMSGMYHVGLQQGDIDGRLEGEDWVGFSFEGMDEMDADDFGIAKMSGERSTERAHRTALPGPSTMARIGKDLCDKLNRNVGAAHTVGAGSWSISGGV
jgi:hypothetical protein